MVADAIGFEAFEHLGFEGPFVIFAALAVGRGCHAGTADRFISHLVLDATSGRRDALLLPPSWF